MPRKGFVFILIFCFWAGDVAATPTSPLGHLLRRVLTRQWQSYSKVPLAQRAFFMYNLWTKHLFLEEFGGCLLSLDRKKFPHAAFHHELGERMLERMKVGLDTHPHRKLPDAELADAVIDGIAIKGFLPGHFYSIRTTTRNHKLFITFNDSQKTRSKDPDTNEDVRIQTHWFVPLEQALLPSCTREYRYQLALLRHWASYSRLSLGFIPAGTEVNMRVGLVAPQSFPRIRRDAYGNVLAKDLVNQDDIEKMEKSMSNVGYPADQISTLYEFYEGGAMQIFIGYTRRKQTEQTCGPYLIPLQALYIGEKPYMPSYSTLTRTDKDIWQPPKAGECSHFLDENWDKAEINIPRALGPGGLGLLSKREQHDWEGVLRAVRN